MTDTVCAMSASQVAELSVALKALLSCCGGVLEIQQECCGTLRGSVCRPGHGRCVLSAGGIPQGPVAAVLRGLVDADVEDLAHFITGAD